jgi:hypothetical protein
VFCFWFRLVCLRSRCALSCLVGGSSAFFFLRLARSLRASLKTKSHYLFAFLHSQGG